MIRAFNINVAKYVLIVYGIDNTGNRVLSAHIKRRGYTNTIIITNNTKIKKVIGFILNSG